MMPLKLITGKPGTGKTLGTIAEVRELVKKEPRPVYYHGIPELSESLGWHQLQDPQKWYECPHGSIIIIDEVQKLWRARPAGSQVPIPVQEIETHRHRGHDLYWMTQDAGLTDQNIRKFVDKHVHYKRIFGLEASTRYVWNQRVARVENNSDYHDALDEKFLFPKDVYKLYKSADVHTVKASVPWKRFGMIGGLIAFFVGALVFASYHWKSKGEEEQKKVAPVATTENGPAMFGNHRIQNPWASEVRLPRIKAVDQSAPIYDDLQSPKSQPKVAGCFALRYGDGQIDCECDTAQGSRVEMGIRECLSLVKRGWFDPTKPEVDIRAENIAYLNARDSGGSIPSEGAAVTSRSDGPQATAK